LPLFLGLLAFFGCLVATVAVMLGAWFVIHLAVPRLERALSRQRRVFTVEAESRARTLFLSKLSPAQRRSWHARRRFTVRAASGRRYTVSHYDPYNIRTADALFCLQVGGYTPVYDKLLAQKLLLECDEPLFLAKANIRTYSPAWEPLRQAARENCLARGFELEA
jgi:hypothetical protein